MSYICRPLVAYLIAREAIDLGGPVAQLNRAFDYGSKGFWFESRRGHKNVEIVKQAISFFLWRVESGEWKEGEESGEWKVGEERYSFVRNKTGLLNKKAASIPERLF